MSALRGLGWAVWSVGALSLGARTLCAQEAPSRLRMSVVAGLAVSGLTGADTRSVDFGDRKGMHLGVAALVPLLGRIVSVAPGGTYIEKGYTFSGASQLKLSYLELSAPLRLSLPIADLLDVVLFGGPGFALEFGCLFKEKRENVESSFDCSGSDFEYRSWDVTGLFGAGLSIPLSGETSLVVNGAIDTSLRSIDSGSPQADFKHKTLLVNAGVSFPLDQGRRRR